jgi:hypothetical protein
MRCLACGAEMILINVTPADAIGVPGFEHRMLQCSACGEAERRLAFRRPGEPSRAEAVPMHPAPPVAPSTPPPDERVAAPSAWARAFARLRGRAL